MIQEKGECDIKERNGGDINGRCLGIIIKSNPAHANNTASRRDTPTEIPPICARVAEFL